MVNMKNKPLKIIVSTDVHGACLSISYANNQPTNHGLDRLSTYLKKQRENYEVLYMDNGDSLQGTPLLTHINQQNPLPHPLASIFNTLGCVAINIGNHDFNYGLAVLNNFISSTNATILTSNILYHQKPLGQSIIIQTQANITLGIIGVTTDYIVNWESPDNIKDIVFLDVFDTTKAEVEKIRKLVDKVIVLYHGGFERDLTTGELTELDTLENVGYRLAQIAGIDVLFSGHQHRSIAQTCFNTVVLQANQQASEVMEVIIDHDEIKASLISLADQAIDQQIVNYLAPYQQATQLWLDQPLGIFSDGDHLIEDGFAARLVKHPIVSFINQVQLAATQADLSATSLFNGAKGLSQIITMRDLVSTYVYPNTLVVKRMSGKQLKAMLEKVATYFDLDENNQIVISDEFLYPKPQHFNYDMIDGITYTIKVSNPKGQRIIECHYQNKPIQDNDTFSVAMNNYRAVGGGNFEMVAESELLLDTTKDMVDLLAAYIQTNSPIQIQHQQNIKVII